MKEEEIEIKSIVRFYCNNSFEELSVNPAKPLLDVIREDLSLTGTKEGCKEGDCGACTVLIGELQNGKLIYKNINSCLYPVVDIYGKHLVTIEGLKQDSLSQIQKLFLQKGASQCGFCTPGFIISFTAFILSDCSKNYENLLNVISGNICRCTGNISINDVAIEFAKWFEENIKNKNNNIDYLIKLSLLPEYFKFIENKLQDERFLQAKKQSIIINEPKFLVSGGTDLYVQKAEQLRTSGIEIFNHKAILREIKSDDKCIFISGNSTMSDVEESETVFQYIPQIREWLKLFGSKPVRNRATVAGNIKNASPIADFVNILLALDAGLILQTENGQRTIQLQNFYLGYKKVDINENEIISEIFFRIPNNNSLLSYEKISKRMYLDIATVNSTLIIAVKDNYVLNCRITAGGVAAIPLFLEKSCNFLKGKQIDADNVKEATKIALSEISPISDARGSKEYKRLLLRQLIYAHFVKLFPETIVLGDLL